MEHMTSKELDNLLVKFAGSLTPEIGELLNHLVTEYEEVERMYEQTALLADELLSNFGLPGNESACEMAIRVLREQKEELSGILL